MKEGSKGFKPMSAREYRVWSKGYREGIKAVAVCRF